jgi:hypothetical protein
MPAWMQAWPAESLLHILDTWGVGTAGFRLEKGEELRDPGFGFFNDWKTAHFSGYISYLRAEIGVLRRELSLHASIVQLLRGAGQLRIDGNTEDMIQIASAKILCVSQLIDDQAKAVAFETRFPQHANHPLGLVKRGDAGGSN